MNYTDHDITAAELNILRDECSPYAVSDLHGQLASAWRAGRDAKANGFDRAPQYSAMARLHWLAWLAGFDGFPIE